MKVTATYSCTAIGSDSQHGLGERSDDLAIFKKNPLFMWISGIMLVLKIYMPIATK